MNNKINGLNLTYFILFEERLRQAKSLQELQYIIVNMMNHTIPYLQAILINQIGNKFIIKNISNVSDIDKNSAAINWLSQDFMPKFFANVKNEIKCLTMEEINEEIIPPWSQSKSVVCIPLKLSLGSKNSRWMLLFWLDKNLPKEYNALLPVIQNTIGYSWEKTVFNSLRKKSKQHHSSKIRRISLYLIPLIIIVLMLIPIHQSTFADAEIVPKNPKVITSSIQGVIKSINVLPNQAVNAGDELFSLDKITIINKLSESQQALKIAEKKYLKAYHHAHLDQESREELNILERMINAEKIKVKYYQELLSRTIIKSPVQGIVLYSDPKFWLGRPVEIGERVMLLANPKSKEVNFWISSNDMINIKQSLQGKFFPNEDPTHTMVTKIKYINPIAEIRPDGTLGYFGIANINNDKNVSIGEKGIIKLYGKKVTVFMYIFRRPIRYVRQFLGM